MSPGAEIRGFGFATIPAMNRVWTGRRILAVAFGIALTFTVATLDLVIPTGGLSDHEQPRLAALRPGGMDPADILAAYNMQPLRDLGIDGKGQTVIVTVPGDGLRRAALDAYTDRYGLPPIEYINEADDPEQLNSVGELEMDLETIHAIAPAARLVVYSDKGGKIPAMAAWLEKASSKYPNSIVSQSWGACEEGLPTSMLDLQLDVYKRAADVGMTVFASSGDNGAFTCLQIAVDWGTPPVEQFVSAQAPSSVPWVTSVGGTRLSLNQDASWYQETTWAQPALTAASGGGPSAYFPRPDWQVAPGVPATGAGATRLTPDVAAVAEAGLAVNDSSYGWWTGGGTSQAAPIWAGMTALFNQYLTERGLPVVGFMNPALYAIARTEQPYPPFHDVIHGGNLLDHAGPGYDLATGLGTPDAWNLVRDLEAYMRAGGAGG